MKNRVTFDDKGRLDEIVTDGGAHLEHLGGNRWFLFCQRADGSGVAVWISGKVDGFEEQDAARCPDCATAIHANAETDGPFLRCPKCGSSGREWMRRELAKTGGEG